MMIASDTSTLYVILLPKKKKVVCHPFRMNLKMTFFCKSLTHFKAQSSFLGLLPHQLEE